MKKPVWRKGRKDAKEVPKKADAEICANPEMQALDAFTRKILKVTKANIEPNAQRRQLRKSGPTQLERG
jgi:hypothetical protein